MLIGIKTEREVVVAGSRLEEPPFTVIDGHILMGASGHRGLVQRCQREINRVQHSGVFDNEADVNVVIHELQETVRGLLVPELHVGAAARPMFGESADRAALLESLIVFPIGRECHLFHFDQTAACMEATLARPFVTAGEMGRWNESFLAFLQRILWGNRAPELEEAKLAAVWTLLHARCLGEIQLLTVKPSEELDWEITREEPAPLKAQARELEAKFHCEVSGE